MGREILLLFKSGSYCRWLAKTIAGVSLANHPGGCCFQALVKLIPLSLCQSPAGDLVRDRQGSLVQRLTHLSLRQVLLKAWYYYVYFSPVFLTLTLWLFLAVSRGKEIGSPVQSSESKYHFNIQQSGFAASLLCGLKPIYISIVI